MGRNGVVDASLLLSLGGASALQLLWDDPQHVWHITPIARGEIQSEPARSEISRAILNGRLATAELDTDSKIELQIFARWSGLVDPGEAEAIAVAISRDWVIGLEDLFAQRRVTQEAGRRHWINAAALLIAAVEQTRMTLSEADAIFVRLDCYPGYRKRGVVRLADLSR
jgi:hypothetical protein